MIIPILRSVGNYLIPLMIGADDMAFPTLNMLSYWFMWPAFLCIGLSFLWPPCAAGGGWTSYPPLSAVPRPPTRLGTNDVAPRRHLRGHFRRCSASVNY